jgi:hypothetical protein
MASIIFLMLVLFGVAFVLGIVDYFFIAVGFIILFPVWILKQLIWLFSEEEHSKKIGEF